MKLLRAWLACALVSFYAAGAACAAEIDDFYRGKTLNVIVGYGPGGGYDLYARLLARFIGAHMPGNPSVVVQNMPGAAGLRAANYMAAGAAKDGTVIATFDMNIPLIGFIGDNANVQYDARKFVWLGSLSDSENDSYVLWARKNAMLRGSADLTMPGGPPLTVGVIGPGATDYDLGVMLRDVFGFRLKIVPGYPSSAAIGLAIENGEAEGQFVGMVSSRLLNPGWFAPTSNMHVILQFARMSRHPELPNAPTVRELAPDEKYRALLNATEAPYKLARPYVAPPGTPADRAAALQAAFRAASTDPALLGEARKLNLDVSPVRADGAVKQIEALSKTPQDVFAKLRALRDASAK